MKYLFLSLATVFLASCSSHKSLSEIGIAPRYFKLRTPDRKVIKVYINTKDDSLTMVSVNETGSKLDWVTPQNDQLLQQPSFDLDVLAIPFKLRPSTLNFPNQLTADFSGNLFMGYRLDRYRVKMIQTPFGAKQELRHRAFTMGAFGGLGTTFVSPWTTNYQTQDEYNGFVLTRGISVMAGIDNLTVGVGIGWDYLTDRDKGIWIYQNKPWFGIAVSLNIN
jgi:hypothetical protein